MELAEFVRNNEGFRDRVYDDVTGAFIKPGTKVEGHPTIGWGMRADLPFGKAALNVEFKERLARAKQDAADVIPGFENLDNARKVAFTDMSYHMGRHGLASFKRMIGNIPEAEQSGHWDDVVAEIEDSDYWEQTPNRAEKVATLILEGSE